MNLRLAGIETGPILSKAQKAANAAKFAVAQNVLADCTEYVPYETGALRGTNGNRSCDAIAPDGDGPAKVMWGMDADTAKYARVQYYGVNFDHPRRPNNSKGRAKWFDKAKAERKAEWVAMAQQVMREHL